ncbi:MAG: phosphate ABC transporter permease subunit PstC [bacterium]
MDRDSIRQGLDCWGRRGMVATVAMCILLLLLMAMGLLWKSWPILSSHSLAGLFLSSVWKPHGGQFGFLAFILGSLCITGVAVLLAAPVSLLTSIYLSEYAGRRIRALMSPLIDLLAGIPSVVYGVWGVLVVVPLVKDHLAPVFGRYSSGYCVLSAGVVLAIMILPVVIHVGLDVLKSVPQGLREASLSLGANRWETVKHVVLRRAAPGLLAANVLGVSRAFGETMAVLMVAGNVAVTPKSAFDPAYPLPALIANNYGEMMSIPQYDSALMLAALMLFVVVLGFNLLSRWVFARMELRISG